MLFSRVRATATIGKAIQSAFLVRAARSCIVAVPGFGSNPGNLRMWLYAPARLPPGRPLIVVLHGCGQDAASFAADAGFLSLAEQFRVALLLPEQLHENNRARCFNWFRPEDVRRGSGEAMSIRQMIRHAAARHGSDSRRIFIAGFSAGGAMAAAMLAAYPAVFAAGGVVAGMPVGCARTPIGAMLRMRHADISQTRTALAAEVRAVTQAKSRKTWPRLTIWQGARDRTVDPANAETLARQWGELHGLGPEPAVDEPTPGLRRRAWGRPNRPPAVDLWTIESLGHGFPVDTHTPACGREGPWVVDAGLCAARLIAAFWRLEPPTSK